jgi:hypothetical protein
MTPLNYFPQISAEKGAETAEILFICQSVLQKMPVTARTYKVFLRKSASFSAEICEKISAKKDQNLKK